ncbi:LysM peptidoglycan-binding domain-containing protein [Bifidobacterium amazonense]|uniref:Lysozyme n=1 Tax=Bifidobacterium amazonense TaxID=2809027 RepID=A0ABS9VV16_9BIFI|nr:GH25 family lysozyme [Bifidobacterium amazonense]MCH9275934.1 LysM peptidoglycan-binding domain-containing protein [Bifidobacterium amazonense]
MNHNKGNPIAKLTAACCATIMLATPAIATADSGVDVSNWQGCVNTSRAQSAKAAGTSFAFVKVTEGAGYTDKSADCSMTGFANAGIRRGVYHFARPDLGNSPEKEADWFISQTKGYVNQGVIPVLDWEPGGKWNTQTWWAKRWLDRVASAWGVKPMIYMSASVVQSGDWRAVASADYGLWVAGYPRGYTGDRLRNPGNVPYNVSPWSFAAAWQYSSSGNVAGVGQAVDVNWFYGDAVTWAKYAGQADTKPVTPPTVTPSEPKPSTPTGDTDTLARAVIRGEYGNMPQRKTLLGSRFDEVQARVNQLLASSGSTSSGSSGSTSVTVRAGDTMSAIAQRTGLYPVTAWSVPSGNINRIYPGQTVTYRGASKTTTSTTRRHTVRAGETLGTIAAANGVSVSQIRGYRSGNPNLIYVGETLYW